jgi:CHASE2 domain-containing sensor protein
MRCMTFARKAGSAFSRLIALLCHWRIVVFDTQLDGSARTVLSIIYQALSPRATSAQQQVVIVGIDDDTIASEGRWPWPRDRVADLISNIHAAGVSVLGVDVLFSEPDTEPGGDVRDRKLAQAIAAGPTILATSVGDFPGSTTPECQGGLVGGWAWQRRWLAGLAWRDCLDTGSSCRGCRAGHRAIGFG